MTDPLTVNSRVRTAYDPQDFLDAAEEARRAEGWERFGELRERLRYIDGGRFHEMLGATHTVLAHSDSERREAFAENYSDHLLTWVRAYGLVEDLNSFDRLAE
jgi:hypothetical protein